MLVFQRIFRQRTRVLAICLAILATGLIVRAAILTVGAPNRVRANLALMNRSPQSFEALSRQIESLQRITLNIDDYKLSEIKDVLAITARVAGYTRTEFQAQYDAWLSIKTEISKDKEAFSDLRHRLDEIQVLQDTQILHLKKLLDESTKPSLIADGINLFISFLTGVFSSVFYDKWKDWRMRRAASEQI